VLGFLGFEARLVPGHEGACRCLGDGGGLGFGSLGFLLV
jgi:hypothetical protein